MMTHHQPQKLKLHYHYQNWNLIDASSCFSSAAFHAYPTYYLHHRVPLRLTLSSSILDTSVAGSKKDLIHKSVCSYIHMSSGQVGNTSGPGSSPANGYIHLMLFSFTHSLFSAHQVNLSFCFFFLLPSTKSFFLPISNNIPHCSSSSSLYLSST